MKCPQCLADPQVFYPKDARTEYKGMPLCSLCLRAAVKEDYLLWIQERDLNEKANKY